ncbi:MAG: homoserine kinase [Oscillospiraceae bacterium]
MQECIYVPATSANVGPGFDSIGLALDFGNTVWIEEAEGFHISSADETMVPTGEDNLVYRSAAHLYKLCAKPFKGLSIRQLNPIPMARGMGSSSACIVAGLVGANKLMGSPCSEQELLNVAADIEGHPDNVAPALLGGVVASAIEDGTVYSVKKNISSDILFAAFVPDFELSTEKARAVLPKQISHKEAVFNISRAALCQEAMCNGRLDLLRVAVNDRLHQPYRLPLIEGGEDIFDIAHDCGAIGVFLSGAGPTILAVVPRHDVQFWQKAENTLQQAKQNGKPAGHFDLRRLLPDNQGARILAKEE